MDVISLLRSKTRCLQRLQALIQGFLSTDGLDRVGEFLRDRDAVFKALDLFDRKLSEAISELSPDGRTPKLVADARACVAEQDRLTQAILLMDNEVMIRIDRGKSRLLAEMASTRKSRELAGKFKSTWIAGSGGEVDKKL